MTKFLKIVLLTSLLLAGCTKAETNPHAVALSKKYGFPVTLSAINGWHGLHVLRKTFSDGSPTQCQVKFPREFGRTLAERSLLNYLSMSQFVADLAGEGNCYASVIVYEALDQLKFLATSDQDQEAARLLLYQGSPDMPFDLDGSIAEDYTESYLLPMLEKYRNPQSILTPKLMKDIAADVCGDLSWRQDVRDAKTKKRVEKILAHIRRTGSAGLADQIIQSCASMEVQFPKTSKP